MQEIQGQKASSKNIMLEKESEKTGFNDIATFDWGTVEVPDGITISQGKYGKSLFATKDFKKGEKIYEIIYKHMPKNCQNCTFKVGNEQYICDKVNSVLYTNFRQIYTFVGFTNHSCDNNSTSWQDESIDKQWQIALRDIKAGEEITCNYVYFDYTCDGHQFICSCGSSNCLGEVKGFGNLSIENKLKILPHVYPYLTQQWLQKDENLVFLDIPQGIEIIHQNTKKLISKKNWSKGQSLFSFQYPSFTKKNPVIIYKSGEKYEIWDSENKMIQNEKGQNYFSCFKNLFRKSVQANVKIIEKQGSIEGECLEDIKIGEELSLQESA